jgi:hypothetical protein
MIIYWKRKTRVSDHVEVKFPCISTKVINLIVARGDVCSIQRHVT